MKRFEAKEGWVAQSEWNRPLHLPQFMKRRTFWVRFLAVTVFSSLTLLGTAAGRFLSIARHRLHAQRDECRAVLTEHLGEHQARLTRLAMDPLFADAPAHPDAADLLNRGFLPWEQEGPATITRDQLMKLITQPPAPTALDVSPAVGAILEEKDWLKHQPVPPELLALDAGWIRKLSDYSSWELTKYRPTPRRFPPAEPHYGVITRWVQIALLQGLAAGDVGPAIVSLRQAARLMFTSESLVAFQNGLKLLRLEQQVFDEALARGREPKGWRPTPAALVDDAAAAVVFIQLASDNDLVNSDLTAAAITSAPLLVRCTGESQWAIDRGLRRWIEGKGTTPVRDPDCRFEFATSAVSALEPTSRRAIPIVPQATDHPSWFEQLGAAVVALALPGAGFEMWAMESPFCSRDYAERRLAPLKSSVGR